MNADTSNVTTLPKPKHGTQKNWRTEPTSGQQSNFVTADGAVHTFSLRGEQSASERFCATCDKWITATGVLGGVWCPTCLTNWR